MIKKVTIGEGTFFSQAFPLLLTIVIFAVLSFLIYAESIILNTISHSDIVLKIHWQDVLIGLTIYLKTSVDFAIFMGNLMAQFPGWRNRISIELGTAIGNALGTMIVLAIWNFFRNVEWLLAIMIIIAALVLLRLAEDGFEHARGAGGSYPRFFIQLIDFSQLILGKINTLFSPLLNRIIPNISMKSKTLKLSFVGLFMFSFSVPFILGLDDFAGYVPLFNIVNVLGFSIGVLLGHMILNIFLFLSPNRTIAIVKNPIISFIGSIAFIILAIWGFREAIILLMAH